MPLVATFAGFALIAHRPADESVAIECLLEPSALFAPLPSPGANDWLARHAEKGQTFEQWRGEPHNVPATSAA